MWLDIGWPAWVAGLEVAQASAGREWVGTSVGHGPRLHAQHQPLVMVLGSARQELAWQPGNFAVCCSGLARTAGRLDRLLQVFCTACKCLDAVEQSISADYTMQQRCALCACCTTDPACSSYVPVLTSQLLGFRQYRTFSRTGAYGRQECRIGKPAWT